jgi:hypothetical protein
MCICLYAHGVVHALLLAQCQLSSFFRTSFWYLTIACCPPSGACHTCLTELKSSVSFDAARRAVSEAKAHAKAKAAALLQASSASWADKLHAAKADRAALQAQLEQLQHEHQQLQQQVRRICMLVQGRNLACVCLYEWQQGWLRLSAVDTVLVVNMIGVR